MNNHSVKNTSVSCAHNKINVDFYFQLIPELEQGLRNISLSLLTHPKYNSIGSSTKNNDNNNNILMSCQC